MNHGCCTGRIGVLGYQHIEINKAFCVGLDQLKAAQRKIRSRLPSALMAKLSGRLIPLTRLLLN
jgi:hypothetical protein